MLRLGNYTFDNVPIPVNIYYKDLGIIVSNNLNFSCHLNRIVNVAHACSNQILRVFPFSDIPTRCRLFCTYVRPILEYFLPIWSPDTLEDIDLIESIQRSFT